MIMTIEKEYYHYKMLKNLKNRFKKEVQDDDGLGCTPKQELKTLNDGKNYKQKFIKNE